MVLVPAPTGNEHMGAVEMGLDVEDAVQTDQPECARLKAQLIALERLSALGGTAAKRDEQLQASCRSIDAFGADGATVKLPDGATITVRAL